MSRATSVLGESALLLLLFFVSPWDVRGAVTNSTELKTAAGGNVTTVRLGGNNSTGGVRQMPCVNGSGCGGSTGPRVNPELEEIIRRVIADYERETVALNGSGVCGTESVPHTTTRVVHNDTVNGVFVANEVCILPYNVILRLFNTDPKLHYAHAQRNMAQEGIWKNCPTDQVTEYVTVPFCCQGYRKNPRGRCLPVCPGRCAHGDCVSPGNCSCHPKHSLDRSGNCVPTCPRSCLNGRCSGNNTCVCNPGFAPSGAICVPVCQGGCVNGNCTAPGVCNCSPGYIKDALGKCIPTCKGGCVDADCTAPNTCSCHKGYSKRDRDPNSNVCVAQCTPGCLHGDCTGPNICTCRRGYVKDGKLAHRCTPKCSTPCVHGTCTTPDVCTCDKGYSPGANNHTCTPTCLRGCVHGTCTAPNVCTCDTGYTKSHQNTSSNTCVPTCTGGCIDGDCTAMNVCTCHQGFRKDLTVLAGNKCIPDCPGGCKNGNCTSPNTCICNVGYKLNAKDECEPHCSERCLNGACTGPDVCSCNSGYVKDPTDLKGVRCSPKCDPSCVNGICSGPNLCLCNRYLYRHSEVSGNVLGCTKPDKPSPSNNIYGIAKYQYRTMFSLPRVFLGFVLVTSALTLETVNYLDMVNIDGVRSTYGQNVPSTLGPSIGVNRPTWGPYTRVNQPTWGPSNEASDNKKNNETKDCVADFLNCYNKTSKQSNVTVSINVTVDCGEGTTCGNKSPSELEPILGANKNLTQIIRDIIVDFERESEFSNYTGVCGTENIPTNNDSLKVFKLLLFHAFRHTITRYIDSNETDANGATIIIETDTQTQYRTVPLCCHGYRKSLMGHCVPKCDGECLHGDCVSPGNCSCHPRHSLDRSGNCVPTCPRSCLNGRCSGNNTCICNPGFAPLGAICVPVCQGGCVNGNCTAPGVCKCDPGYVSDNTNTCVPSCPGTAVAPDSGFRSFGHGNFTCVPKEKHPLSHVKARGRYYCDTACINGNCTKDNVCTCYPGFVRDPKYRSGNRCTPYCPGGCGVNGNCTAPNTCVCRPGYYRDFYKKQCLPFCPGGCVNGDCVAPDLCVCRPGYQMDFYKKQCVVARCTGQNCVNGVCTSQGACVCNRGYVRDYVDASNPRCVPYCQHGCVNAHGKSFCKTTLSVPNREWNPDLPLTGSLVESNALDHASDHLCGLEVRVPSYRTRSLRFDHRLQLEITLPVVIAVNGKPYGVNKLTVDRKAEPAAKQYLAAGVCPPGHHTTVQSPHHCTEGGPGNVRFSALGDTRGVFFKDEGKCTKKVAGANTIPPEDGTPIHLPFENPTWVPPLSVCGTKASLDRRYNTTIQYSKIAYREVSKLGWCLIHRCRKRKTLSYVTYDRRPITRYRTVNYCCRGYTKNEYGICEPICDHPCVNSNCISPNICSCEDGYPDTCTCKDGYKRKTKNECSPICEKSCVNAMCTAPNICTCSPGYEKKETASNKCFPSCPQGCINSTCVAPDTCRCNDGYIRDTTDSSNRTCLPFCAYPCANGDCTAPNTCTCHKGFAREVTDINGHICFPECPQGCSNGRCVAPDTCECNPGYEKEETDLSGKTCNPKCSHMCINGICSSPETCQCLDGYEKDTDSKYLCNPVCLNKCENADCSAPNVCKCWSGYEMDNNDSDKHKCVPVCDKGCIYGCVNGECVAPNICSCLDGYEFDSSNPTNNSCVPICSKGCVNSNCREPEVCTCFDGYEFYSSIDEDDTSYCAPVCADGCFNSNCTEPNTCKCLEGYEKDLTIDANNTCIPICSHGCLNGFCSEPDICTCFEGYEMDPLIETNHSCVPVCSQECVNSICEYPQFCLCLDGYEMSGESNNTCNPVCLKECINSNCTDPNTCSCFEGFEMDVSDSDNMTCQPVCQRECVNGNCTAPEKCSCWTGFIKSFDDMTDNVCVPSCPEGCGNGTCIAPNTCMCEDGFTLNTTSNICVPICDERRIRCEECHPEHTMRCDLEDGICYCTEGWFGPTCHDRCKILSREVICSTSTSCPCHNYTCDDDGSLCRCPADPCDAGSFVCDATFRELGAVSSSHSKPRWFSSPSRVALTVLVAALAFIATAHKIAQQFRKGKGALALSEPLIIDNDFGCFYEFIFKQNRAREVHRVVIEIVFQRTQFEAEYATGVRGFTWEWEEDRWVALLDLGSDKTPQHVEGVAVGMNAKGAAILGKHLQETKVIDAKYGHFLFGPLGTNHSYFTSCRTWSTPELPFSSVTNNFSSLVNTRAKNFSRDRGANFNSRSRALIQVVGTLLSRFIPTPVQHNIQQLWYIQRDNTVELYVNNNRKLQPATDGFGSDKEYLMARLGAYGQHNSQRDHVLQERDMVS
uniref:EGF-like domain-containing protein n=1 Tax=Timema monikensis TaxID=170555 RepID=A0A7R9E855_9NEOP|nr:unnamed protein product [Timema monikensis]